MDYLTIIYLLVIYIFWQHFHMQNLLDDSYDRGVKDGVSTGYILGRSEIDEDMYEQGKEAAIEELKQSVRRKAD